MYEADNKFDTNFGQSVDSREAAVNEQPTPAGDATLQMNPVGEQPEPGVGQLQGAVVEQAGGAVVEQAEGAVGERTETLSHLVAEQSTNTPIDAPPTLARQRTRTAGPQHASVTTADATTTEVFSPINAPGRQVGTVAQSAMVARNVSAWYGGHKALDRISLDMRAGEITALIGPSGCGKSTFLRILNRMHELIPGASLSGEVMLDGSDIYGADRKITEVRKDIGMVFQKPNPFPAMSIYDNVIAGLKMTGVRNSQEERDQIVERSLKRSGLWNEVKDRLEEPGAGLSGGQQQRLCIARALAVDPKVLLMDEPCSALDPTSTRVIEETMIEMRRYVTIVIVTHNMQQAERVSQRCAFFLASLGTPGQIVEYGQTDAIFHHPQDQRTLDYVNGNFG